MIAKQKTVYYCEHCKKHSLLAHTMVAHEKRCTGNIERECRWNWGEAHDTTLPLAELAARLRGLEGPLTAAEIGELSDNVEGCPACMLTVLKASGRNYAGGDGGFDYRAAVEAFNAKLREQDYSY